LDFFSQYTSLWGNCFTKHIISHLDGKQWPTQRRAASWEGGEPAAGLGLVAGIGDPFLEGFEARGLDHVGFVEEAQVVGAGAQAKRTPTINSLQEDKPNTLRQEKTKD
jgi:hypothetical protein